MDNPARLKLGVAILLAVAFFTAAGFGLHVMIGDCKRVEAAAHNRLIQTYDTWIKFTDNPKDLTFDEWHILKNSNLLCVHQQQ